MKLAIVGSRTFTDYKHLESVVDDLIDINQIECVISGGAKGTDSLAEQLAKDKNIEMIVFPADWTKYGKSAGMIRNKDIIKNADIVIAFWDSKSKGTKNSIDLAKKLNKKLFVNIIHKS